jgi:hypothetical protein
MVLNWKRERLSGRLAIAAPYKSLEIIKCGSLKGRGQQVLSRGCDSQGKTRGPPLSVEIEQRNGGEHVVLGNIEKCCAQSDEKRENKGDLRSQHWNENETQMYYPSLEESLRTDCAFPWV